MWWPWSKKPKPERPARREDAWANFTTGLGTSRDKRVFTTQVGGVPYPLNVYSELYQGDGIAATIVDALPKGALRRGYIGPSKAATEKANAIGFDAKFLQLLQWGRAYGGALLVLGVDDGKDPSQPVGTSRGVRNAFVISRRRASIERWDTDPLSSTYGEPLVYRIAGAGNFAARSALIHATRVLRWDGVQPDELAFERLAGWSWSVLHRPYEILRDFATASGSLAHLVSDASQGVFKMKGLLDMVAHAPDVVEARMELLDTHRSAARAVTLDSDGEDFSRVATSFAGIPETVDRLMAHLSAVTGIPQAVLFGRAPAGLNATGESDVALWYDEIDAFRSAIGKLLRRFYSLLGEEIEIEWPPLEDASEAEQIENATKRSAADAQDITSQVLMPEEAALLRYGDEKVQEEVLARIIETRRAMLTATVEFRDPTPPTAPPPAEDPPAEDNEEPEESDDDDSDEEAPESAAA